MQEWKEGAAKGIGGKGKKGIGGKGNKGDWREKGEMGICEASNV